MNARMIDHEQAISTMMAERYLLGELADQERDAYEAHLFECEICFAQVKAGTEFIRSFKHLDEQPVAEVHPGFLPRWMAGFRQPVAAWAVALCILAVGLNLYQYRQLSQTKGPALERSYVLTGIAHGGESAKLIEAPPGSMLSLRVEYTPSGEFTAYGVRILSEAGAVQSSIAIPRDQVDGIAKLAVPANSLKPGKYSIIVWGRNNDGNESELGRGAFELRLSQ